MCGIVCYLGVGDGLTHVLNALDLLTYRAPDSSGLAVVDAQGRMVIRRAVGTSKQLQSLLEKNPFPPLPANQARIVAGHGRWAMVGAVTEANAHPIPDRSGTRVICENGSHDATIMLRAMREQAAWWRERGAPAGQPVHRSENTSEVLVCEWERNEIMLEEGTYPADWSPMLSTLQEAGITDREEIALRFAVHELRAGNAHACAFYSSHRPETLFATSHHKPVAIIARQVTRDTQSWMVASDINAGLMLWTPEEVARAAQEIEAIKAKGKSGREAQAEIQAITEQFTIRVLYLDHTLAGGETLFARIDSGPALTKPFAPTLHLSHYCGRPLPAQWKQITLNPAMVGKRGFASYTESHIDEIPDVLDSLLRHYVRDGQVDLRGTKQAGRLVGPGLDQEKITGRFGSGRNGRSLPRLRRILLIGEGSSWRDAQCAAPLLRDLLPGVLVNVYRPVAFLNLGPAVDPQHDLAVEISWSGTTDGVLKADAWLHEMGVLRVIITGRPQSDLGRRGLAAAGTLDVITGVEVSVATVKGFAAILLVLDLLALQLAAWRSVPANSHPAIQDELIGILPTQVRAVVGDQQRRKQMRELARRLNCFNKVVVVGDSPVDMEAELKIEELAQVVAAAIDFHSAGLRHLIERSAWVSDDAQRILFIINATTPVAQQAARPVINYLHELGVFGLVHTTLHPGLDEWQKMENLAIFVSPAVSPAWQPLIDAPFFFDLAVALAYGRGLTAEQIDRPRNLAKSVTTTGADRRPAVENRPVFTTISLADFARTGSIDQAWNQQENEPSSAAFQATVALRAALAVLTAPLPAGLSLKDRQHLVVIADTEASEIGATMSALAWQTLHRRDLTVYRRFLHEVPQTRPDTTLLRLVRAGAFLSLHDAHSIHLPTDFTPLQLEILSAVYLTGLAVRLARQQDRPVAEWERGLARLPLLLAEMEADEQIAGQIRAMLAPFVTAGYDKVQIIGGGQDFIAAESMAHSLRLQGIMAEELYTDSAWHGPLATVGGPGPAWDTLIVVLATDPLFQAAALVDTQVYRARHAQVILVVPQGNGHRPDVRGVDAGAVISVPAGPRSFLPVINAAWGSIFAAEFAGMVERN